MDQKSWLWKKKSTEKTLVADKASNSYCKNEEEVTEVEKLIDEKACLEKEIRILNEKLSSTLSDCTAKDNIAKKQVKIAEEANAGWAKAETRAIALKQELDMVLQRKASSDERVDHLDAALKECMHELRFVREEQERRVLDAVTKASEDFEKIQIALDDQIVEASKKLAKSDAENAFLSKALSGKDKVIEDLGKYISQLEIDSNALSLRLESMKKENTSLKYEVHVLEKELDIRSEEREFNCRTADVAQKKEQESAKKIANLETECQRLRVLVQKWLPGPAALAKMKTEVKSLIAKDHSEMKRSESILSPTSSVEFSTALVHDVSSERINLPTHQLYTMVEENRSLKEALNKKSSELQHSRNMCAFTSSKLPQAAGLVEESFKCQVPSGPDKYSLFLQGQHLLAASCDVASDDKAICAESCTSATILELENSKNEKQLKTQSDRNMTISDMNLMDDFAEMEKLAVLSVDDLADSPNSFSEQSNAVLGSPGSPGSPGFLSLSKSVNVCAPICDCPKHIIPSQEIRSGCVVGNGIPARLGDLLKIILEHSHSSQINPQDLLEDIKFALAQYKVDSSVFCGNASSHHAEAPYKGNSHVLPASLNKFSKVSNENNVYVSETEKSSQKSGASVSMPIHKVLELLEGINLQSQDNGIAEFSSGKDEKILSYENSGNPVGYIVRVFQWKTAELSAILQKFVQTCNDLLTGTADFEQFVLQVASSLEWVMSHCFSIQDVSSMKDAIRSHLDWNDSGSESEEESEPVRHVHISSSNMEALQLPLKKEVKIRNVEWTGMESEMATGSEGCLFSETCMHESFISQPQESKRILNLQTKMEAMDQWEGKFHYQFEKQKMVAEDLETQLMESDRERTKACERISLLESELATKNDCHKRLEETCLELQIQIKRITKEEVPDNGNQEKQHSDDWEITAASEKLAECQETILNLGKQLKALASPCDAALFDKFVSAPTYSPIFGKNISRRSSLLGKMLAEDSNTHGASSNTKNENCSGHINSDVSTNAAVESLAKCSNPNGINHEQKTRTAVASMEIVPRKKHGGTSFFKRLFSRRKKAKNGKPPIS